MRNTRIKIKETGEIVQSMLTKPAVFEILVEKLSDEIEVSQARASAILLACYSYSLNEYNPPLGDFLRDWLGDQLQ